MEVFAEVELVRDDEAFVQAAFLIALIKAASIIVCADAGVLFAVVNEVRL